MQGLRAWFVPIDQRFPRPMPLVGARGLFANGDPRTFLIMQFDHGVDARVRAMRTCSGWREPFGDLLSVICFYGKPSDWHIIGTKRLCPGNVHMEQSAALNLRTP